jgi:hypothetical protein
MLKWLGNIGSATKVQLEIQKLDTVAAVNIEPR